jgi:putative endonuclease
MLLTKKRLFDDSNQLGRWGEKRCEKFLKRKGLHFLVRNYTCPAGELDLIMVDTDSSIVFVEVKTRTNEEFTPAETAVNFKKQQKLSKTARYFLAEYNIKNRPYRFDIVTIVLNETGRETISHYPNAFIP